MKKIAWMCFLAAMALLGSVPGKAAGTEGRMDLIQLGDPAPDFTLTDVISGEPVSLMDFKGHKGLLVIMLCRHCPFVQHVKQGLTDLGRDYAEKDVVLVAISSNDPTAYPDDAPERLKQMALEAGWKFPVLFDQTQDVGRAYTAVATPDFFLFDENRRLVYRGQMDDSRPGNDIPVTGSDIRKAIEALLAGKPIDPRQKPSSGCSIKWRRSA